MSRSSLAGNPILRWSVACTCVCWAVYSQTKEEALRELVSLEQLNLEEYEPAIRDQVDRAYRDARQSARDSNLVGRLGMLFQVYGKYELAEACYQRARGLDPASFRWAYYLANIWAWQGKHAQAIELIREALEMDPSYVPARVRLAELLFDSGDAEQSSAVFRQVIGQDPKLAPAHLGLGKVLAGRGDHSAAITEYRRACELSTNYAAAHYALGMAYRRTGDLANARLHLSEYQRLKQAKQPAFDPMMEDVQSLYSGGLTRFAKGSQLVQQGKTREAAAEFEAALEANPRLVAAHVNLIAMYGQLGQPDKAEQHFRAAVDVDPGWAETYYNWGLFLVANNRKTEAEGFFRKAVELNPNYADAHVQLASVLDQDGRPKEAAPHYAKALQTNPNHRQAHYLYGHNLVRSGQIEEAIKHFLETIHVDDERAPLCMQALGIAYQYAGNMERARYYLEQARQRAELAGMTGLAAELQRDLARVSPKGVPPQ